jgi:hypothetical protein
VPKRRNYPDHETAGYDAIHLRLKRDQGAASSHVCPCGEPATQWAYQHCAEHELSSAKGPYSLDQADYLPMCYSCHARLDGKPAQAHDVYKEKRRLQQRRRRERKATTKDPLRHAAAKKEERCASTS